jgi:hypothetical protein
MEELDFIRFKEGPNKRYKKISTNTSCRLGKTSEPFEGMFLKIKKDFIYYLIENSYFPFPFGSFLKIGKGIFRLLLLEVLKLGICIPIQDFE